MTITRKCPDVGEFYLGWLGLRARQYCCGVSLEDVNNSTIRQAGKSQILLWNTRGSEIGLKLGEGNLTWTPSREDIQHSTSSEF